MWYIGSHWVVAFEQAWYKTIIVDNLSNSCLKTLRIISELIWYTPKFYETDLRDKDWLEEIFKKNKIDWVIHFAWLKVPFESQEKSILYFQNNITWSLNVFEIMEKYKVKNIVFSSSANTYCTSNVPPIKEDCIQSTTNPYWTTKLLIEKILEDLSKFAWFNVINLRYFNPIWAHPSWLLWELPDWIPNNLFPFIFKVLTWELKELNVFGWDYDTRDGTWVRDYIDVCDLVDAHILAYEKLNNITHPYHTSSTSINTNGRLNIEEWYFNNYNVWIGRGITVLEAIKTTEKVFGKKVNYKIIERRMWDIPISFCDTNKIKNELWFEQKVSLEESLKNSWKFYNG